MAKRVVVFNDAGQAPAVKVRKAAGAPGARTAKKETAPPASQAVKKEAKPAPAKKTARNEPNPEQMELNAAFRARYLEDLARAADNARRLRDDESRSDRRYYAEKLAFLEKLISVVEGGKLSGEPVFGPLSEPFFWNEFKRLSEILRQGPKNACPDGKRISPAWRRAANRIGRLITKGINQVREGRDGYVLRCYPMERDSLVLHVNGAMMYLERQIAAQPRNETLPALLEIYGIVYAKSGMKTQGEKIAAFIKENRDRPSIWKNQETVDYLLSRV